MKWLKYETEWLKYETEWLKYETEWLKYETDKSFQNALTAEYTVFKSALKYETEWLKYETDKSFQIKVYSVSFFGKILVKILYFSSGSSVFRSFRSYSGGKIFLN